MKANMLSHLFEVIEEVTFPEDYNEEDSNTSNVFYSFLNIFDEFMHNPTTSD